MIKALLLIIFSLSLLSCISSPTKIDAQGINSEDNTIITTLESFSYEKEISKKEESHIDKVTLITDLIPGLDLISELGEALYGISYAQDYTKLLLIADNKKYTVLLQGKLKVANGDKFKLSIFGDKITGIKLIKL